MTDPADMAPDASPGTVVAKSGVRRVNSKPLLIFGAVVIAFLVIMALVASDRAARQTAAGQRPLAGNTSTFAKALVGNQNSGLIDAPPVVPDLPQSPPPALEIVRPEDPDAPPLPARGAPDDEVRRIREAKWQMFADAVKAKTTVRVDAPRSSGSAPGNAGAGSASPSGGATSGPARPDEIRNKIAAVQQQIGAQLDAMRNNDPSSAYQAQLAQLRGGGPGAPPLSQPAAYGDRNSNSYEQFGQTGQGGDRWRLDSQPEAPRSPYELRTGFVIPATLISGINSDLPGLIIAQVAQDVFDTATGKWMLIPQGSRLIGQYSSGVAYGQSRVLVAWQRIVFPDGKALDIGAMPGADSAGYAGLQDQVNNHFWRIFGSAFLMSGITAGITISQNCQTSSLTTSTQGVSANCALEESLGNQLGMATAQLIAKNLTIAPTLEIRPGYRFNVVVTKDMTFSKPYRSFDY